MSQVASFISYTLDCVCVCCCGHSWLAEAVPSPKAWLHLQPSRSWAASPASPREYQSYFGHCFHQHSCSLEAFSSLSQTEPTVEVKVHSCRCNHICAAGLPARLRLLTQPLAEAAAGITAPTASCPHCWRLHPPAWGSKLIHQV